VYLYRPTVYTKSHFYFYSVKFTVFVSSLTLHPATGRFFLKIFLRVYNACIMRTRALRLCGLVFRPVKIVRIPHEIFRVSRQHLRSASQRKVIVPRYRLDSYGRRCFAVAGPSTWNSLPDSLRDSALSLNFFKRHLKTHFFCEILTRRTQRIRDFFSRECAV